MSTKLMRRRCRRDHRAPSVTIAPMSVATHLGIDLREYDQRIRTFIPDYEEMIAAAAAVLDPSCVSTIVDLGIGTGALAARCLARAPHARVVRIDADPEILALAARRLGPRADLVAGNFTRASLPRTDALVASFSLHHVRTGGGRTRLYSRVRASLRRGGLFVSADCYPAADAALSRVQMRQWHDHVRCTYSASRTAALFAAWSREDVYVPLDPEVDRLTRSGFSASVVWRKGAFAVVGARRAR